MPKKKRPTIRLCVLPIDEVMKQINGYRDGKFEDNKNWRRHERKIFRYEFQGISVKISSLRLTTFKRKGIKCKCCGLEASHFAIDKQFKQGPQLNLFGMEDGEEILFTKDHILPKSKGGKDCLNNMQTMCTICNCKKGNNLE